MTETASGKVIVANLSDQFRFEPLPFRGALCAPTAGAARSVSGEPGTANERLDDLFQLLALLGIKAGREADMIKQAFSVATAFASAGG